MSSSTEKPASPVLFVGGAGAVGSRAVRALRQLHPRLPIWIGGRDLAKAAALADEIGSAGAVAIDLTRPDLGLPAEAAPSGVVMLLKDDSLLSLKYAQAKKIPYIAFSNWLFDIGPEVAHFVHAPRSAPVLLLGHILGGTVTLAALHFAGQFRTVDAIELGAVLDSDDSGGPAAQGDMDRIANVPNPPLVRGGKWHWAVGDDAVRRFKDAGGAEHLGRAIPVLDVASLAAATLATSVRVDLAVRDAKSRPAGSGLSHEVIIEIAGEKRDGATGRFRYEYADGRGHSVTSGFGAALAAERLLGLAGGPPPAPGLYCPESLLDPVYVIERMRQFGTRIRPL